jgi:ferritin
MIPLISDSLKDSLVQQIAEEKKNANIYLSIASYLNGKGLSNLAKKFEEQHSEETEHSLILYKLLSDLSIVFNVPAIELYDISSIDNIVSLAELYLDREYQTTESLGEIKKQSMDEDNYVVEERIREMIKLQQTEYAEATEFLDRSNLLREWWQVALWDSSLGG